MVTKDFFKAAKVKNPRIQHVDISMHVLSKISIPYLDLSKEFDPDEIFLMVSMPKSLRKYIINQNLYVLDHQNF